MKALIVGAGIAGLTAGVLLKRKGWDVRVLETRPFIGGNCADYLYNGVHVHRYGPHIFHTSDQRVWSFVNEFCSFTNYVHKVVAKTYLSDQLLPVPYSKATEKILGRELTDQEIRDAFFVKYSEKMWGRPYAEIPDTITGRVQLRRDTFDPCYFLDKWQGMPSAGYAQMFMNMADEIGHGSVELGVPKGEWQTRGDHDLEVFTGQLDEYYDLEYGHLPYRAIQFSLRRAQPRTEHAVTNWCDDRPMTRTTDFSRFYDRECEFTVTCDEYPVPYIRGNPWAQEHELVPSYPMRDFPEAQAQLEQYLNIKQPDYAVLAGRLGTYWYRNMDAVVADTMVRLERKLGEKLYA